MSTSLKITLTADAKDFDAELQKAKAGLQAFANGIKGAVSPATDDVDRLGGSILSTARAIFVGVSAANVFQGALAKVKQVIESVIESTLALDRAQRTLQYATGDGATALAYVRKVANELGLDLTVTAEAYGKLAASARGTSLQGQATRDIFKAVTSAATVMGLGAQETSGMVLALGQMMSKGKVQAEELRNQLGERLPGAYQIAARAMGVTTAQLGEMLEKGQILAEDFLPKFAAELTRSLGDAPKAASTSLQAGLNRAKTAWTEFLLAVGQSGVIDAAAQAMNVLTGALNQMTAGGGLRAVTDLLGNFAVQMVAVAWASNSLLIPALLRAGTAVVAYVQTIQVQMALAAMAWRTGTAVGPLQAFTQTILASINPWMLAAAAIVGIAYGMQRWAQSYQRAAAEKAEADARMRGEATEATRAMVNQHNRAQVLEKSLRDSARGSKAHTEASKELNGIVQQLVATYPDFLLYLRKEGQEYTNVADSMDRYSRSKIKQLKLQLEDANVSAGAAASNKTGALVGSFQSEGLGSWGRAALNFAEWTLVGKGIADDAEREEQAHRKSAEEIRKQIAMLESWESGAPKASLKLPDKSKEVVSALEHQARLRKWEAESAAKVTLEDERQAGLLKIKADEEGDLARIAEERAKGKLNEAMYLQERVAILNSHNQQRLNLIQTFDQKREEMEEDLQRRMTAHEEGGLEKRYAATEKAIASIRELNKNLVKEGQAPRFSEDQILSAEAAAKARDRADQVQQDLGKLERELANLAQIKGGALTLQEMEEAMQGFGAQSVTAADAVEKFRAKMHIGEGGWAGALAGVKGFVAQSQNHFEVWKNAMTSILGGLQNSFAQFFESIFQKGMTGAQKWDALWKGIVKTILGALSQMAAQWLVAAVANRIFGKAMQQAEAGKAIASQHAAAAGIFAAWSWSPIGPAIAAGLIAMMNATLAGNLASAAGLAGKATAMAVGGRIDRPTLALMGEAGPELVAPERDFKDWARGMVSLGANLQSNISGQLAEARGYDLYRADLAAAAAAQGRANVANGEAFAGGATLQQVFPGAIIVTRDSREWGEIVESGRRGYMGLKG